MPRHRRRQPGTPENLPDIPEGGDEEGVLSCWEFGVLSAEPRRCGMEKGEISEQTTITSLHVVIDEATAYTYNVRAEYIRERRSIPSASHDYQRDPESRAHADEDEFETTAAQASSSTDQGWYLGHGRTDSGGSDPLAWTAERYEQETGTIDQLVETLDGTDIGGRSQVPAPEDAPSAWSEWAWHADRNQEGRYRTNHGKYEYQWRDPGPGPAPDDTPSAWSEWAWHADRNQEGRYRTNHGEYEYQWRDPAYFEGSRGKEKDRKRR